MKKIAHPIDGNAKDTPPWVSGMLDALALHQQRTPQALMVHGPQGNGRRLLALHYAARLLGIPASRLLDFALAEAGSEGGLGHPDFMLLRPLPDKKVITVERVRELLRFLQLKSHQGGSRVAVIWPAEAMNRAAANSLLKTLEEPPAGGYIVLVAASPAALPATVTSRCHRVAMRRPSREQALGWLEETAGTDADWKSLLDVSSGAPLRALELHHARFMEEARQFALDLKQLEAGQLGPVAVAQRWSSCNAEWLIMWLYWWLSSALRQGTRTMDNPAGSSPLQKTGKLPTMSTLLQRLSDVEQLRRTASSALRMELQYAAILQRWYG